MPHPVRVDRDTLLRDQALSHAAYVNLAAAGMLVVIVFLAFAYWPVVDRVTLAAWLTGLAAPFALRLVLARAYTRDPSRHDAAGWVSRFRATFALHGLAWAAASLVVFPAVDATNRSVLAFVVAGVTASALNTSAFDLVAGLLVLGLAVAPWSLRMLVEGGRVHTTTGAMLALFLGYMALNGVRIHRRYLEALALRQAAAARAGVLATYQAAFGRLWQTRQTDASDLMTAVTREAAGVLGLTRARLVRFDHEREVAVVAADTRADATPHPDLPLASCAQYLAALSTEGRLSTDGDTTPAAAAELAATSVAYASGLARMDVPLGHAGRLSGVLCCERAAGPWTADETTFLTTAAATLQAGADDARRRLAEQRLRDLNLNLEHLVQTRTSALRASEARLAQALDATNDGLWDFDLAGGGLYVSPVLLRLLGHEADTVPPTVDFFRRQVHPDDLEPLRTAFVQHRDGLRPTLSLELRMMTASGAYRWFLAQGKMVERGPDGTPQRLLGTISDITTRRRALEDLHESETRFRALFDKSPVIVTLLDLAASRVAEMNEVGLRTFGYTRDEVLGRTTLELQLWADEHARRAAARQLISTGLVSGVEIQLRRKSGEVFWGLLSSSVVTFQGQPYALAILQDITERRRLEARILQTQKMEVVGHLAGGVAHDFNNVLTIITSTAELAMSETRDGDPMHEALTTIRAASTRAARLTGQLLAVSRQQILQPAALDLNDLVTGLAPMVRRVLDARVTLDLRPRSAPVAVLADRGSLEQVILNLAINARDAMPDGGTLTIAVDDAVLSAADAAVTALEPGRYARLSVSDTGTGMSEATKQRIFEPFFTTKEIGRGTGLGLSMAHGVVQQSGGDIVVRSALGEGTSFTIYLPLTRETPVEAAAPSRAVEAGHETVLVVDDDADIREVLRRALRFAGYEVVLSATGEEALARLQERGGEIDLLLTDVMMPGIGGRELAERVRAAHPCVRILFTSGYAEHAIARHGVLADGVQFIAKPYSLQALTRKVRDVLDAGAGA